MAIAEEKTVQQSESPSHATSKQKKRAPTRSAGPSARPGTVLRARASADREEESLSDDLEGGSVLICGFRFLQDHMNPKKGFCSYTLIGSIT